VPESRAHRDENDCRPGHNFVNFPAFFPVSREFGTETGSQSTASSTTQPYANRDFPVHRELARTGGGSCVLFVSASCRLDFRGPYGAFVSAPQKNVSRFRRPVLAETRFECGSVRRKAEHLALPGPFGWQVGEASDAHALREAAIDGRFDEIG
jgi:hypothetical protein